MVKDVLPSRCNEKYFMGRVPNLVETGQKKSTLAWHKPARVSLSLCGIPNTKLIQNLPQFIKLWSIKQLNFRQRSQCVLFVPQGNGHCPTLPARFRHSIFALIFHHLASHRPRYKLPCFHALNPSTPGFRAAGHLCLRRGWK